MDFVITTAGIGRRDIVKKILIENGYEVKQMYIIASDWTTTVKVKDLAEAKTICEKLCLNPSDLTIRISEV